MSDSKPLVWLHGEVKTPRFHESPAWKPVFFYAGCRMAK
jgi:hypothetical protein